MSEQRIKQVIARTAIGEVRVHAGVRGAGPAAVLVHVYGPAERQEQLVEERVHASRTQMHEALGHVGLVRVSRAGLGLRRRRILYKSILAYCTSTVH